MIYILIFYKSPPLVLNKKPGPGSNIKHPTIFSIKYVNQ